MEILTRAPAYFVAHFKVSYLKSGARHIEKNTPVIMHLSYGSWILLALSCTDAALLSIKK